MSHMMSRKWSQKQLVLAVNTSSEAEVNPIKIGHTYSRNVGWKQGWQCTIKSHHYDGSRVMIATKLSCKVAIIV